MPTVIIVKPNNTEEQEKKALRDIEYVMQEIILEEFGVKTKVTIKERSE